MILCPVRTKREHITLVDTTDVDGDEQSHHAQAERVFRWSQMILFVVTPEKYQMTELIPYYRLARRDTQLSVDFDQPDRRGHVMDRSGERLLTEFGRTAAVGCPPAHGRVAVPLYRYGRCLCLQVARGPTPSGVNLPIV